MINYKILDENLKILKSSAINLQDITKICPSFNPRDSRIVRLDFDGDIAQLVIKSDGFILKLYPIACFYNSKNSPSLVILNSENFEVNDYIKNIYQGPMKINKLNEISFIENLLWYHSGKLDYKIKNLAENMKFFTFDNIQSQQLSKIAKLFHELLLLKNQYQEIQQTLTQINEMPSDKLKIIGEINKIEEFSRIINIYQNQFEEDIKNLIRMTKEIEILIQMTDIKFAEKRNKIAILSLNLDLVILTISIISMVGSIFGMNLNSSIENVKYCLYYMIILISSFALFIYNYIKKTYIEKLI
tara:strand:- start:387 stop:1289 length:903 start_codon:yes stop_codon:yes gene_type:complete